MHFKRVDKFFKFEKDDLKHHPAYLAVRTDFSRFYGQEEFTLKQADQSIWQAAKSIFLSNTDLRKPE